MDKKGCLKEVNASGHALGSIGNNLICAAATVLIRTAAKILEEKSGIEIKGRAKEPGELFFSISKMNNSESSYLKGITDYLCLGLKDLEKEDSSQIRVGIQGTD